MRKKVKVKTSLKVELDLVQGVIVTVIDILNDGWVLGITSDNKTGTFPETFIVSMTTILPASVPQLLINQIPTYKDFDQSSSSQHYEEPAPYYFGLFLGPEHQGAMSSQPTKLTLTISIDWVSSHT